MWTRFRSEAWHALNEGRITELKPGFDQPNPTMSSVEITYLKSSLRVSRNYFEYGGGFSTYYACSIPTVEKIVTVETDAAYLDYMLSDATIGRAYSEGRFIPVAADYGPLHDFGIPKCFPEPETYPEYAAKLPFYTMLPFEETSIAPDLILIDGILRNYTAATLLQIVGKDVSIIMHDYNGPGFGMGRHRTLEQFYDVMRVDTMGILVPKDSVHASAGFSQAVEAYRWHYENCWSGRATL